MTISDLEQLLREYIPDPCAGVNGQGRASVTARANHDDRYSSPEIRHYRAGWNYCLVCGKEFSRKNNPKYCSDACKQKAYRERKKKQRA